jgi:hypothetical protein
MTGLLEKAFAEAAKLPEGEQEALAAWILEELASEQRGEQAFARLTDLLAELADEALEETRFVLGANGSSRQSAMLQPEP